MSQRAMLCPRCRKIIGSNEITCSWCGAKRASTIWHFKAWTSGALDGDWIVRAIITLNIVFFILSLLMTSRKPGILNPLSFFSPDQTSLMLLGATGTIPVERFGRFWTIISANYLHGGILHLVFNLMALRQIAPWVVNEYGSSRMFAIYTFGGAFGFWVSNFAGVPFTIGASAALCALIGSLLYFGKSRGGVYGAAVYREVIGWVVGLFLFGLMIPGINNWGHGGGIAGGVLFGMLLGYNDRRAETAVHRILAVIAGLATAGVLGWAVFSGAALWFGF